VTDPGERDRKAITTGREYEALVPIDRGAHDRVVMVERHAHPLDVVLPPRRRALDVGEQERHRPRRRLLHVPNVDPSAARRAWHDEPMARRPHSP